MVTKWGLSDKLGPLTYGEDDGEVFLGRSVTKTKEVSDETAHLIDGEIRHFIDKNYQRAESILQEQMDKLHLMAEALIKYETIDEGQIADIMAGNVARPPQDWSDDGPSGSSSASTPEEESSSDKDNSSLGDPAQQH